MAHRVRTHIRVQGVVQGVGFRPFVYGLATKLGLAGLVGNDVHGVFLEIEGPQSRVDDFLASLTREAPPLAAIERVTTRSVEPTGALGFTIVSSDSTGERQALVSADSATCADCLRELADPTDRRYGYPFINCTNCGPRFTIVRDVPYDRPFTTMAGFTMCAECSAEYHDPANRRFHAQPVCCPECGPRLRLVGRDLGELPGEPIAEAAALLLDGRVLAVKGLGGYHLAVDATNEIAAAALRNRKHREDKPFAVMVSDLADAHQLVEVDDVAESVLIGRRRPIALLPRCPDAPVVPSVAPGNRRLGIMLPYTPLHHLLLRAVGRPIVLTSGNVSDEPIAYRDEDAFRGLADIADAFLTHNRPIHVRTDDSVVRPHRGQASMIRRSRGYAPEPVSVSWAFPRPLLACGAELKNTFCLAKGHHVFVSHHIGDLENAETLRSFTEGIEHFQKLFDVVPRLVAYDLHPEYLSTKYALDQDGVDVCGVQHHHAHIASCLADNGHDGPVIGVAFDGTGYGTDGTIWGGEFLLAELTDFRRVGYLDPIPMPGGTAAIKQPWRMAAAYLDTAYGGTPPEDLAVRQRNEGHWAPVVSLARRKVYAPLTSSAGRLFDAVSAILGVRDAINYEGQAAVELEQLADPAVRSGYPAAITSTEPFRISGTDLVRAVADEVRTGADPAVIAARFHRGVAEAIVRTCCLVRDGTGVNTVALSGGVFQNLLLTDHTMTSLRGHGFEVLTHSRVPCNDGGISLGQAVVAAARDRTR